MSNKELVEELIPEFVDVEVTSSNNEQPHIEEVVTLSAENEGHTYKTDIAFEDSGEMSELKKRETTMLLRELIEHAVEDTQ